MTVYTFIVAVFSFNTNVLEPMASGLSHCCAQRFIRKNLDWSRNFIDIFLHNQIMFSTLNYINTKYVYITHVCKHWNSNKGSTVFMLPTDVFILLIIILIINNINNFLLFHLFFNPKFFMWEINKLIWKFDTKLWDFWAEYLEYLKQYQRAENVNRYTKLFWNF